MLNFFLTHRCSPLCRSMGLTPFLCTNQGEVLSRLPSGGAFDAEAAAAASGAGIGRTETLGAEVLTRLASGEAAADAAPVATARSDPKAGPVEAMGRLHCKLALHCRPGVAERAEQDALAKRVDELRRGGEQMEASLFHAVVAAAILRCRMPAAGRQQWLAKQLAGAAKHVESSLKRFDGLLLEYDKTEEILEMRGKWVSLGELLLRSSHGSGSGTPQDTGLTLELCGVCPGFMKLVAKRDVLLRASGLGSQPEPGPGPEPEPEACSEALGLRAVQLELSAAEDLAAALLLWSGEEAELLPEETERVKYPTLHSLVAVGAILEPALCLGDGAMSLAERLREAEETVKAELRAPG